MEKYRLTEETINVNGIILYRIEALKDFGDVKEGNKGGFVENDRNLSHDGNCWVYSNAKVFGNAEVWGNARVYGNAEVYDNAEVWGNAEVDDNAQVFGNARVFGNAQVYGEAQVFGNAQVADYVEIGDNAIIFDNAQVCDSALIFGNAIICGYTKVCGNAEIKNSSDYIVFKNWWSSGRFFTWTKSNNMWSVGCFYGSGRELIEKAYKDSEKSGVEYERVVNYVESILTNEKK